MLRTFLLSSINRTSSRSRIDNQLSRYDGNIDRKLDWKICDVPDFCATSGVEIYEALDIVHTSVQDSYQKEPQTKAPAQDSSAKQLAWDEPSVADLTACILREGKEEIAAISFWESSLTGDLPEWNHRSHLRARFLILLDSLL